MLNQESKERLYAELLNHNGTGLDKNVLEGTTYLIRMMWMQRSDKLHKDRIPELINIHNHFVGDVYPLPEGFEVKYGNDVFSFLESHSIVENMLCQKITEWFESELQKRNPELFQKSSVWKDFCDTLFGKK